MSLSSQTQQQVAALTKATDAVTSLFNSQSARGTVFDSPLLGNSQENGEPNVYRLQVTGEQVETLIMGALTVIKEQSIVSYHVAQAKDSISSILKQLAKSAEHLTAGETIPATSGRHSLSNSVRELSRINRFISNPEEFQYV